MRHFSVCLMGTLLLVAAGCRSTEPVGTAYGPHRLPEEQRLEAQVFDPYPSREAGPEVVGGRPPSYQVPRAETQQLQPDRWQNSGGF